jgi:hypothetical protein
MYRSTSCIFVYLCWKLEESKSLLFITSEEWHLSSQRKSLIRQILTKAQVLNALNVQIIKYSLAATRSSGGWKDVEEVPRRETIWLWFIRFNICHSPNMMIKLNTHYIDTFPLLSWKIMYLRDWMCANIIQFFRQHMEERRVH